MDKDNWVADVIIHAENGQSWSLKYYVQCLITKDVPVYGLRIEKYNEAGELIETETTPGLFNTHAPALDMARVFAANSVPPCVLLEITDEWFGLAG